MLDTQSDTSFVKTAVADELSEGVNTFLYLNYNIEAGSSRQEVK